MSIRTQRIRALIESSGKSYVELEKLTGVKKSSLQRYATGTTAKIPLEVIEKLSKTFGVTQEYLMGWEEEQKKNDIQADIILRMRSDSDFSAAVESLYKLDKEKLQSVTQMLITLFK